MNYLKLAGLHSWGQIAKLFYPLRHDARVSQTFQDLRSGENMLTPLQKTALRETCCKHIHSRIKVFSGSKGGSLTGPAAPSQ